MSSDQAYTDCSEKYGSQTRLGPDGELINYIRFDHSHRAGVARHDRTFRQSCHFAKVSRQSPYALKLAVTHPPSAANYNGGDRAMKQIIYAMHSRDRADPADRLTYSRL